MSRRRDLGRTPAVPQPAAPSPAVNGVSDTPDDDSLECSHPDVSSADSVASNRSLGPKHNHDHPLQASEERPEDGGDPIHPHRQPLYKQPSLQELIEAELTARLAPLQPDSLEALISRECHQHTRITDSSGDVTTSCTTLLDSLETAPFSLDSLADAESGVDLTSPPNPPSIPSPPPSPRVGETPLERLVDVPIPNPSDPDPPQSDAFCTTDVLSTSQYSSRVTEDVQELPSTELLQGTNLGPQIASTSIVEAEFSSQSAHQDSPTMTDVDSPLDNETTQVSDVQSCEQHLTDPTVITQEVQTASKEEIREEKELIEAQEGVNRAVLNTPVEGTREEHPEEKLIERDSSSNCEEILVDLNPESDALEKTEIPEFAVNKEEVFDLLNAQITEVGHSREEPVITGAEIETQIRTDGQENETVNSIFTSGEISSHPEPAETKEEESTRCVEMNVVEVISESTDLLVDLANSSGNAKFVDGQIADESTPVDTITKSDLVSKDSVEVERQLASSDLECLEKGEECQRQSSTSDEVQMEVESNHCVDESHKEEPQIENGEELTPDLENAQECLPIMENGSDHLNGFHDLEMVPANDETAENDSKTSCDDEVFTDDKVSPPLSPSQNNLPFRPQMDVTNDQDVSPIDVVSNTKESQLDDVPKTSLLHVTNVSLFLVFFF